MGKSAAFIRHSGRHVVASGLDSSACESDGLECHSRRCLQDRAADVLDRIDQIVAPGVTVNPDDNSYGAHELTAAARRR
jgi:hypothetical protein